MVKIIKDRYVHCIQISRILYTYHYENLLMFRKRLYLGGFEILAYSNFQGGVVLLTLLLIKQLFLT